LYTLFKSKLQITKNLTGRPDRKEKASEKNSSLSLCLRFRFWFLIRISLLFFISFCFRFGFCFSSVCVWVCWYVWVLVFFSYLEFSHCPDRW
jgi:asparagine N-glycosylation enzyme membrane subunit Stt3